MITKHFHLLAVILLSISCPLTLLAHDIEAKNADGVTIYYNKLSDTECEVTYYGTTTSSAQYSGAITIPASITYDDKTLSVTSIGDNAFSNCRSLTSISLPNSITSIGKLAFDYCYGLTSISLPNSLTSIGASAFSYCSALTSISLPDGITSIGKTAFYYCSALTTISLPSSLTTISEGTFWYCTSLTSFDIPNTITSMGLRTFYGCSSLTSVTIPSSVTSIGDLSFCRCTALTSITVDPANPNYSTLDGVLFNKNQTFLVCCPGGKQGAYTLPNSVTAIGNYAFSYCTSLTSVTLPNSMKDIGYEGFSYCSALTSISLSNSLNNIQSLAFSGCSALTSVTLPDGVPAINDNTFGGCKSLTSIIIPSSVKTIGKRAFSNCTALTSVTNYATTPQKTDASAFTFYNVPLSSATLYVPESCKSTYASTDIWRDFGTIIGIETDALSSIPQDASVPIHTYTLDGRPAPTITHPGTITIQCLPDGTTRKQIIR